MKQKLISILIGLLSLSIAGIIAVQTIWINNALRVKDELFARNAAEALQNTVSRLENLHNIMVINQMAFPDSVFLINRSRILPPNRLNPATAAGRRIAFSRNGNRRTEMEILFRDDSLRQFNYTMKPGDSLGKPMNLSIRNQSEEIIVVRQGLNANFDSLMHSGLKRLDSLSDVFDTLARSVPAIPQIHIRASNLQHITEKAVNEIVALDRPEIDPEQLENILSEELLNRNIPIKFQFGVFRDSTLLLSSENTDTLALISSPLRTGLFPNSLFRRNQQLSLYFPGRDQFIFRSMSWLLAASLLFSAIVLITFSASVLVLLRQKKISEMKSDFINNMTHEFKTPIATIAVASDSLFNDKVLADPEKIRYFSGMIRKENQRMNRQVEDILTIARLEKKEIEFNWEAFDLHDIVNDAIEAMRVQVTQREGQILALLEATNPVVVSDRKHLTHAIINLLDNANKYTVENPRIHVKTRNADKGVILSVTDNGIGMNKQVLSRIFERFYRQSSGNIHNVKGFGLGLSYTRAVIEAGKGTIRVESEPGKGSTFELFLPGNS
jgi:two-component system, OmpR family, phosphate regulon sensor histidine kinase PhoR